MVEHTARHGLLEDGAYYWNGREILIVQVISALVVFGGNLLPIGISLKNILVPILFVGELYKQYPLNSVAKGE